MAVKRVTIVMMKVIVYQNLVSNNLLLTREKFIYCISNWYLDPLLLELTGCESEDKVKQQEEFLKDALRRISVLENLLNQPAKVDYPYESREINSQPWYLENESLVQLLHLTIVSLICLPFQNINKYLQIR